MKDLRHQRILANAGSGKTYRLTSRYLELLFRGVPAERIIALTFTRKAAGEFLAAIFARLLRAMESEEETRRLGGDIGFPGVARDDCRGLLRELVDKLPRLALGTLDSFFGRVVRAFPFECGLPGEPSILDNHSQETLRRDVLSEVFRRHLRSEDKFAEFLELVRLQSRNRESRNVASALDEEVAGLHEAFLLTPLDKPWGDRDLIWRGSFPWPPGPSLSSLVEEFQTRLFDLHSDMEEKYREGWEQRLAALARLFNDVPKDAMEFALKSLDPVESRKIPGHFELKLSRKTFVFPDDMRPLLRRIGQAIIRIEILAKLDRSKGLHDLLRRFEEAYQTTVRESGRLTFQDITGMLASAGAADWSGTRRVFDRQQIDYRLDATYDHWLLDEFQDTSRLQWQALRNLVDEVIQSDSGRRSFFYVGDAKQAIYSWRGGDTRLFQEIADFYNASGTDRIDTSETLAISYRSVPEVLDGVNRIFRPENLARFADDLGLPPEVLARWENAWADHKPSKPAEGRGCVTWQTVSDDGGEGKKGALDSAAAGLIKELDPLSRGWTCAVLVATNSRIASVIDYLREAGIPASSEGRFYPCRDNPLGSALLSLFRAVAHPQDTFSLGHAAMTPLAPVIGGNADAFRSASLRILRDDGFSGLAKHWISHLRLDEFSTLRAEEFLRVAEAFDTQYGAEAGIDAFVAFAESFTKSEPAGVSAVRVMTVHASKGLDFDMVVLPDLEGGHRDGPGIHLHTNAAGTVEWGMELPRRAVCEVDPVLGEAAAQEIAEAWYERLCFYYVALTRAKRALYLLSSPLKEETTARDFNRILHETFGKPFESGNLLWHLDGALPEKPPAASASAPAPIKLAPSPAPISPSAREALLLADDLFDHESSRHGLATHAALAGVAWLHEDLPSTLSDFFDTPAAVRIFTPPSEPHTLWREKPFDVFVDDHWVSGVFDRVLITFDPDGEPARAVIYDFKTELGEFGDAHRSQMDLYRKSLAALTGLPLSAVTAVLVRVPSGEEFSFDS